MTREPISEKGITIRMQDPNTVNRTQKQHYFEIIYWLVRIYRLSRS